MKTRVTHVVQHGSGECLGINVWLWCPGCNQAHAPRFRCPDHGGPTAGPVWDGDPYSDPFTMSPSLLVHAAGNVSPRCHSFVRNGMWQFLDDCTHEMRGQQVPLMDLPDWLAK